LWRTVRLLSLERFNRIGPSRPARRNATGQCGHARANDGASGIGGSADIGLAGSSAMRTTTRAPRLRSGLAVAQLALSLMLLVGALLLVATLRNLHAVDLGFNPQNLSAFGMDFVSQKYDPPRTLAYRRCVR
jgi:hypothetical protein